MAGLVTFLVSLLALAGLAVVWAVHGIARLRGRPRREPPLLETVVVVLLAAISYLSVVRPLLLSARQVQTLVRMQAAQRFLDSHFERWHRYPPRLADASPRNDTYGLVDGWGRPLYYESRGGGYVLAGLGSDHARDEIDYWELREAGGSLERVSGDWSADQVASDRGFHRAAGK